MPFELGIAVAIALTNRSATQHQFRIFEAKPYRLQKSLSDLLGHDPFIHGGRADGVLDCLLNVFSNLTQAPDLTDMRVLNTYLQRYRRDELGTDIFQPKPFSKHVVAARALVG